MKPKTRGGPRVRCPPSFASPAPPDAAFTARTSTALHRGVARGGRSSERREERRYGPRPPPGRRPGTGSLGDSIAQEQGSAASSSGLRDTQEQKVGGRIFFFEIGCGKGDLARIIFFERRLAMLAEARAHDRGAITIAPRASSRDERTTGDDARGRCGRRVSSGRADHRTSRRAEARAASHESLSESLSLCIRSEIFLRSCPFLSACPLLSLCAKEGLGDAPSRPAAPFLLEVS